MERTSQVEEEFRVLGKEARPDSHKDGSSGRVCQSSASSSPFGRRANQRFQRGRDLSKASWGISALLPSALGHLILHHQALTAKGQDLSHYSRLTFAERQPHITFPFLCSLLNLEQ